MPLQKIVLRPGVNRETSALGNKGGWFECDKIRFRSNQVERIGGWSTLTEGFLGVCRNLTEWMSLSNYLLLGIGTNLKYYILSNDTLYDITPIRLTTETTTAPPNNPFTPIFTTLNGGISATAVNITVTSGTTLGLARPLVVTIGTEQIYVSNVDGNVLAGCTRGYNGTTASAWNTGSTVTSSWLALNSPTHGAVEGDYFTISGAVGTSDYATTLINSNWRVAGVSANYVFFDVGILAINSTTFGGANVVVKYELSVGNEITARGSGWGAGIWNAMLPMAGLSTLATAVDDSVTTIALVNGASFAASGYIIIESEIIQYTGKSGNSLTGCTRGSDSSIATSHEAGVTVTQVMFVASATPPSRGWNTSSTEGISIPLRIWDSDTFGQDLIYAVRGGPVFYWTAGAALSSAGVITQRGVDIVDLEVGAFSADTWAPTVANGVICTEQRHIVVIGTNDPTATAPTALDPMLVRWCEQEDPLVWEPTPINTAGFQRLTYGSRLITAEKTRQEVLIWSDTSLYSMRYLGPPYTFGFNTLSNEITIVSPNAVTTANNITYWMGNDKFYMYSGRVDTLPCTLRQYVFDDFNQTQDTQVYSAINEKFNEIWWFYPSSKSNYNDRYVVYNFLEQIWYYGNLSRSAWYDSKIRDYPIATNENTLYLHEYGLDDGSTAPPTPIHAYITSADFDLGEGIQYSFIKRVIPDIVFIGSTSDEPSATITLSVRDYPGQGAFRFADTVGVGGRKASIQVYNFTESEWIRLRGRQAAMTVSSDTLGTKWQLGVTRIDIQPDGRR